MFLETKYIANPEFLENLKDIVICSICTGVLINPVQCNKCENSYCKKCIEEWSKVQNYCPMKCKEQTFKEASRITKNILSKIHFICPLGCFKKMDYQELLNHAEMCKKENLSTIYTLEKLRIDYDNLKKKYDEMKIYYNLLKIKKINDETRYEQNLTQSNNKIQELENIIKTLQLENINLRDIILQYGENFEKSNYENLKPKESKENIIIPMSQIKIIITECEHYHSPFIPICEECFKAFPCENCHNSHESHNLQNVNKNVLCDKCYGLNDIINSIFTCKNKICSNSFREHI